MFKFSMETDKISDGLDMINSVTYTLNTNAHINELITAAHRVISNAFILHMSQVAFGSPEEFKHMYDWGRVGDPNGRLWKHILRGAGSSRVATFEFKASKKSVPLSPAKIQAGVQKNHIFVWKAPVLELGLPVRISPKIATTLVLDSSDTGELIYTKRSIYIPRQGSEQVWGSFTNEFMRWFGSGAPSAVIKERLEPKIHAGIKQAFAMGITKLNGKAKSKTMKIRPVGLDKSFVNTLNQSLRVNYIEAARNRRVDE